MAIVKDDKPIVGPFTLEEMSIKDSTGRTVAWLGFSRRAGMSLTVSLEEAEKVQQILVSALNQRWGKPTVLEMLNKTVEEEESKTLPVIPKDFEVQPLGPGENPPGRTECGQCGLAWDDDKVTSWTPAPSGRCPFEYFHQE